MEHSFEKSGPSRKRGTHFKNQDSFSNKREPRENAGPSQKSRTHLKNQDFLEEDLCKEPGPLELRVPF